MATFSFKSSGKTSSIATGVVPSTFELAIGFKTPLQLGEKTIFAMNYNIADQVHDNLRNLLLTNWGERLGFYYFGANLRELTTEISNVETFEELAIERIREAVSTWMPFVNLKNFSSKIDKTNNNDTGIIRIMITYSVPQLLVENRALQISLFVI
jgi:phage baseplate assembly protein W